MDTVSGSSLDSLRKTSDRYPPPTDCPERQHVHRTTTGFREAVSLIRTKLRPGTARPRAQGFFVVCAALPLSSPRRPQWTNVPERPRLHGLCGLGCAWGASEQNLRVIRTCWGALGEARTTKQIALKERSGMLASTAWCLSFTRWQVGVGDCDQSRTGPAFCRMQVHEHQFSNTAVARGPHLCPTDGWEGGNCQNG